MSVWTVFVIIVIIINHFQFILNRSFMRCIFILLYCRLKICWTIFYRLNQARWPIPWNWMVHTVEVAQMVAPMAAAIRIWLSNRNHQMLPMLKCMHSLRIDRKRTTITWVRVCLFFFFIFWITTFHVLTHFACGNLFYPSSHHKYFVSFDLTFFF